jgi:hypothetical protein
VLTTCEWDEARGIGRGAKRRSRETEGGDASLAETRIPYVYPNASSGDSGRIGPSENSRKYA